MNFYSDDHLPSKALSYDTYNMMVIGDTTPPLPMHGIFISFDDITLPYHVGPMSIGSCALNALFHT